LRNMDFPPDGILIVQTKQSDREGRQSNQLSP
jgi:hypothetical protein